MSQPDLAPTLPIAAQGPAFEQLSAVAIVDLLLASLALRGARSVTIEPSGDSHAVRYERGVSLNHAATLSDALGDAVVARLSILAGLPLGGGRSQVGQLRVRVDPAQPEVTSLLVAIQRGERGLSAEVRRVAGARDDEVAESTASQRAEQAGHYRLLGSLAVGGMGTVYRAEHVILQKQVALKVLNGDLSLDPLLDAQFVVEARAACRVRHPGVVDVTDFGHFEDGRAFFVMELVEAPTLADVLASGSLPPARALAIARAITAVLDAVGDSGVVHRDLKPSNIFVLPGDAVKIADFGLATIRDARNQAPDILRERILGTALYMAPEQCCGKPTDQRCDLYALGCILYEMLTGRPPFSPVTPHQLLLLHMHEPPPPPVGPEGPLPDAIARLLERALAKRPEDRFQSAREMGDELLRAEQIVGRGGWRQWLPR